MAPVRPVPSKAGCFFRDFTLVLFYQHLLETLVCKQLGHASSRILRDSVAPFLLAPGPLFTSPRSWLPVVAATWGTRLLPGCCCVKAQAPGGVGSPEGACVPPTREVPWSLSCHFFTPCVPHPHSSPQLIYLHSGFVF